uniref:Uncharacterized protein n=1 Tax=Avena sativa TaxID=4498 RepID=A0ACD5W8C7_AVESA
MASQEGAEGSAVAGAGNENSAGPLSQRATPISEATPASQAASPTSQAATPTSQATSSRVGCKRKKTSTVWDEMEEKFEDGKWKAYCKYCHKRICAGSRSGTTHLRAHLDCCPARHAPIGPKQQKLRLTKGEGGKVNIENVTFDQEKARRDLGLMICEHEFVDCRLSKERINFEKYWKDIHGLMSVATVLDPRYKLHILNALYGPLYGREHAATEIEKVKKLLVQLSRADLLGGWNSTFSATFQSVLEDDEEEMDESTSIITQE